MAKGLTLAVGQRCLLDELAAGRNQTWDNHLTDFPAEIYVERTLGDLGELGSPSSHGCNGLLGWYRDWSSDAAQSASRKDPLLALAESGARLWSDEHADEYVRRLREGWE
jgi:hypothetical protein